MFAGLTSFMDEAASMSHSERIGDHDGEAQERPDLHGLAEESLERLAARVFANEGRANAVPHELHWPRGPRRLEHLLQREFMGQAIERRRRGTVRGRNLDEDRSKFAAGVMALPAAERTLRVLP